MIIKESVLDDDVAWMGHIGEGRSRLLAWEKSPSAVVAATARVVEG